MHTKNDDEQITGVFPSPLTEAAQLIARAKNLILGFYEENPNFQQCIEEDVFNLDDELAESACRIGDIAKACFIKTNFFEFKVGKETCPADLN